MVMPVMQQCPQCHKPFMGSDAIGRPCFACQTGDSSPIDFALMETAKADLLARAATDDLTDDDFHTYFEDHCPGSDWLDVASEASRLLKGMPTHINSFTMGDMFAAIAAEAYDRGIANAAKYLGVDGVDLKFGVMEHRDGDRETLTGVSIPRLDYAHKDPE